MFDTESCYTTQFLGKKQRFEEHLTHLSEYRFKAKCRTYFVSVEHLTAGLVAIKYCDVKDLGSKNAYKKIFNDHDGGKVIASCIKIMHNLWKHEKNINFGFYAIPRDIDIDAINPKRHASLSDDKYREKFVRARFNIYEHAMINLFPPASFWHVRDYKNCLYFLLNKDTKSPNKKLGKIVEFLLKFHNIIFEPTIELSGSIRKRDNTVRVG